MIIDLELMNPFSQLNTEYPQVCLKILSTISNFRQCLPSPVHGTSSKSLGSQHLYLQMLKYVACSSVYPKLNNID